MSSSPVPPVEPIAAWRNHWPEYLCESLLIAVFMISACVFSIVLFHPASGATTAMPNGAVRRAVMGLAMGLTAVGLIYSSPGQRSGAHMNPAFTLAFWRLGKINSWDALFYVAAQFLGGMIGVGIVEMILPALLGAPSVQYAATLPGPSGAGVAWLSEFGITLVLMVAVLIASNNRRLTRWTGLIAGLLVACYITLEAPLSGMSMNPARTFGSAIWGNIWTHWWIYFTAPPLAMLLGAEIYLAAYGRAKVYCAKLQHVNDQRCIFRCEFDRLMSPERFVPSPKRDASDVPEVNPHSLQPHLSNQTPFYG